MMSTDELREDLDDVAGLHTGLVDGCVGVALGLHPCGLLELVGVSLREHLGRPLEVPDSATDLSQHRVGDIHESCLLLEVLARVDVDEVKVDKLQHVVETDAVSGLARGDRLAIGEEHDGSV
jgi:hypothetical protein